MSGHKIVVRYVQLFCSLSYLSTVLDLISLDTKRLLVNNVKIYD